jgi:hypothetical protein
MSGSVSSEEDNGLLAAIEACNLSLPERGQIVFVDVLNPSAPPGSAADGPVHIWVPRHRVAFSSRARDAGRHKFEGPLKTLVAANGRRSSIGRTAGLLWTARSDSEARAVLAIAMLRVVQRQRNDLSSEAEACIKRLLPMARAASVHELWHNRTGYTLPYEIEGIGDARGVEEFTAFFERWSAEIASTYLSAFAQPRVALHRTRIKSSAFRGAFDLFHAPDRFEVHGKSEWKQVSREDLEELIWQYPLADLSERFGVARGTIRKAYTRMGIVGPPPSFWKLRQAGKDVRPLLEEHGIEPPASFSP